MPLLPYVYGLAMKAFSPTITVGRWLSFVFGLLSILTVLSTFRTDKKAAVVSGLLLSLNLSFVFDTTIFKTQALTVFLTALSVSFLSPHKNRPLLGLFFLNLSVLTRLSMLPALMLSWIYVLVTNRDRLKRYLLIATANVTGFVLLLVVLNQYAAGRFLFGIYTFHDAYFSQAEWSVQTLIRFLVAVSENQCVITIATVVTGTITCVKTVKLSYRDRPDKNHLFPVFIFLCWFTTTVVHATRIVPYATYQTSNIIFAAATIAPVFGRVGNGAPGRTRIAFLTFILLLLMSMPFQEYPVRLDGDSTIEQYRAAVHRIHTLRSLGARTLLTFNPELAASSGLRLLPGYEMGTFSYFSHFDENASATLKVKNERGFLQDIERQRADVLALTGENIVLMLSEGDQIRAKRLFTWLQNGYRIENRIRNFGQYSDTLYIYRKKTEHTNLQ